MARLRNFVVLFIKLLYADCHYVIPVNGYFVNHIRELFAAIDMKTNTLHTMFI